MKKILIIIFYFGSFPSYFDLFLASCGKNSAITWRIYTDNVKGVDWPDNVEYIQMKFNECRELFQKKFDFQISMDFPQKLCDYKPAYGYILENDIGAYDYWGHCDIDVIFGDMEEYLQKIALNQYDKLFSLGHFTLYRNDKSVNRYFMDNGSNRYQEVFQMKRICGFDEWGAGNINELFQNSKFRFLSKAIGADIWPESTPFFLSWYHPKNNRYAPERGKKPCIFMIDNGKLYQCWEENGILSKKEFPYIHIQKRSFKNRIDVKDSYYIVPRFFVDGTIEEAIRLGSKKYVVDWQYIKVKWRNLRHRIRMGK